MTVPPVLVLVLVRVLVRWCGRYCAAFANGTSTWLESTCYNSLQPITPHPTTGAPRALLCYDRMGTEPPAAPPQCQPDEVMTFCMQLTHSAFLGGGPE